MGCCCIRLLCICCPTKWIGDKICHCLFHANICESILECATLILACLLFCTLHIFPPLGVFVRFGCGKKVLICLILTCLGYVPGFICAACLECKKHEKGDKESS